MTSPRGRALGVLGAARSAAERLADPKDGEALHDFRVAVRRLLTTLDAFPRLFAVPPRRTRARLKRLRKAAGPARDAEVMLEWVSRSLPRPDRAHERGVDLLLWTLGERRRRGYEGLRAVPERFARLAERLRVRLDAGPGGGAGRWRRRAGRKLASRAKKIGRLVAGGLPEGAGEHKLRIQVRKARYLLEPFEDRAAVGRAVAALRALQTLLGDLHDRIVFASEVARLAASLPSGSPERGGLAAAARKLGREERSLRSRARAMLKRRPRLAEDLAELALAMRARTPVSGGA